MRANHINFQKARQLMARARTSFRRPTAVAFELTNRCNAKCAMCPRDLVKRNRENMNFDDFCRGVDSAVDAGVKAFQLSFFGESLLYNKLEEAITYIKSKDPTAVCVLNTNGSLLTEEKSKAMLEAGINSIRISIEGNSAEEYNSIRRGMDYNRLEKNVKTLRNLIDEGKYSCSITIQGLNIEGHPIDRDNYIAKWSQWADAVGVRNDHDTNGKMHEPLWHRLAPCPAILGQVIVLVDGRTTICAYDWAGEKAHNDITQNSISRIWHSRYLWMYRVIHLVGLKKLLPYCRSCNYQMGSLGV